MVHGERMKDNGCNLKQEWFQPEKWKTFRTIVRYWSNPPREIMQSPYLEVFQNTAAHTNLVWPPSWPCFEQLVRLETAWYSFQVKLSYDLVILWSCDSSLEGRRALDLGFVDHCSDLKIKELTRKENFSMFWIILYVRMCGFCFDLVSQVDGSSDERTLCLLQGCKAMEMIGWKGVACKGNILLYW